MGPVFTDEQFADLFPARGRPALSPAALAMVSVLQFAEGLSDRQAAHAVRARIDWKYALGLELTDPGFDHSVLSEFRDRLIAGAAEARITDAVLEAAAQAGLLKTGGRQRTDSTHVKAAIRDITRLEMISETMRAALNALAAAAPEWLSAHVDEAWFKHYSHRVENARLPKRTAERIEAGHQVGEDGMRLLRAVLAPAAPAWLRQVPAVEALRRFWVQEFLVDADDRVRWRHPDETPPAAQRLVSPYDLETRTGSKREMDWFGWKVHLTETCEPDAPNLITNVLTTPAPLHDVQATDDVHASLAAQDFLPTEHFVDSGYVEARHLVSARRDYGIELVGPVQGTAAWQGKKGGGFAQEDFAIDWDNKTVTCPNGKKSSGWYPCTTQTGAPVIRVNFGWRECGRCPVRAQCTKSTTGGRRLTFRKRDELEAIRQAREDQRTDAWQQRYHTRAGIESTMAFAVHTTGVRRTRYRGSAKTHLQHRFTAAGINLARIDAWLAGIERAPSRISHFARLRPAA